MTEVRIFRKNGKIEAIEVEGHTGFDEYGKDIVCAALSTIIQVVDVGLKEVLKYSCYNRKQDKAGGFMGIYLQKDENCEKAQILLETAAKSFKAIEEGYSDYVNVREVAHSDD